MNRRSALLVATALLAISFAAPLYAAEGSGQLDDCIFLRIGNVIARAGDDIEVPITISNTTGWGIMALEGKVCWCDLPAGLLQYEGCMPARSLLRAKAFSRSSSSTLARMPSPACAVR